MTVDELVEHAVMMTKTIWRRRGETISRHVVKRLVASDVPPRTEDDDAS
jgi:1,2-phenylacetyl-CoA epoxidase PaaB subunit